MVSFPFSSAFPSSQGKKFPILGSPGSFQSSLLLQEEESLQLMEGILECCSMRKPGSHGWKLPREPGPTWLHSPCSAAPRLGWAGKGKPWNNLRIDSVKTPAMSSPRSLSPAQLQDHQILRIRWQEFLPLRPKLCLSQEKNVWNVPSLFSTGMGFRCRDPTNHGSCQKSLLWILGWLPWDNPN